MEEDICARSRPATVDELESVLERSEACSGCSMPLKLPYVRCLDCADCAQPPPNLCLACYSRGVEVNSHKSDHGYEIMHLNFPVLEEGWTAEEELRLVKSLANAGFGNWPEVAQHVQTKTAGECERHYMEIYIDNPPSPLPTVDRIQPVACPTETFDRQRQLQLRPTLADVSLPEVTGYMACRGDFDNEYLDGAEMLVRDIEFEADDCELTFALKMALVHMYQSVLEQREFRKRTVRDHGLINHHLHEIHEREFGKHLNETVEQMRPFMRLQTPEEHEKLLEGLAYEQFLESEIKRLQDYRNMGIMSRRGARLQERIRQQRLQDAASLRSNEESLRAMEVLQAKQAALFDGFESSGYRRKALPLDLTDLPGVERLTAEEQELCSMLRLMPHIYESYKIMLREETERLGQLRLADARRLLRIDVNKTRRLYDFFVTQNIIVSSESKVSVLQ